MTKNNRANSEINETGTKPSFPTGALKKTLGTRLDSRTEELGRIQHKKVGRRKKRIELTILSLRTDISAGLGST